MKKILVKTLAFIAVLSIITCALSACGSPEQALVGQWVYADGYGREFEKVEFFSDGTYVSNAANYYGSYSVSGDRIRLEGFLVDQLTYTFKVSGDKLMLGNLTYVRE